MAPTMPVSAPSAGGSKNAIALCGAIKFRRMRVRVSRLLAGCGNFLTTEDGANPAKESCSEQETTRDIHGLFLLSSSYHLSNDHWVGKIYDTSGQLFLV